MGNARVPRRRARDDDERPAVWSAYGKLLRLFRDRAGLTQPQLGDAMGYSMETVGSVEQGRRPAKAAFTEAAERALDAGGALRVLQDDVDRAKLPEFFRDFALLESEAVSRFSYDPLLVPGLLQTEDYPRALIATHFPPLNDEAVDERVSARLARQALLSRESPPIVFSFIVQEAALHRKVGGVTVLRHQLRHLMECAQQRNVEVQVIQTELASHSGLSGPMVLLESTGRQRFVSLEAQGVVTVRCDRDEASEFWLRYGMLRSQALSTEESSRLIERVAGEP